MRLKFVKGKQREIIDLLRKNFTWDELSDKLGISKGHLKADMRNEKVLLSGDFYKKSCKILGKNFDEFILEKFEDNWGLRKGGLKSSGNIKSINEPEDSKEFAEFYGIMLGDGNSHRTSFYKSRDNKRGVYRIRIVGDSRLDNKYLVEYVKPLIEDLFRIKVRVGIFKPKENFKNSKNGMFIEAHSVELVNFLESKGFKPGNKIKNKLRIPSWIKVNKTYLSACLRGLYDTDGSVYKLTNQNSYQFCFTNHNSGLLNDVRDSLLLLGINCSRISKGTDIYITKKEELRKFLKLIGFSNNRHLKKIKMWNLESPVV